MTAPWVWGRRHHVALLYGVLLAGIASRNLVGLVGSPPGLYVDEASIGYNAWALGHYGVDEHGIHMPLYPEAFGEYKNPVYIYVLALISRFWGMSVFLERLPAALFGMAACIFVALAVRRMCLSDRAGWLTLLLAVLCPWLTLESRVGFEVISMVALLALALWCLAQADSGSWRWYLGAGAALAVAIFAYSTARLEIGLFAVMLGMSYAYPWRKHWWVTLGPISAGYAGFGLWWLAHPTALTSRYDLISITRDHPAFGVALSRFWANYQEYFGLDFIFFHGDSNPRQNTGFAGMLLLGTLPLLVLGVIWCLRHIASPLPRFLLLGSAVAPVAAALTDNGTPHALRAATMLPFALVLAGCGAHALLAVPRRWGTLRPASTLALALTIGAVLGEGIWFNVDMYAAYPIRPGVALAFNTGYLDALVAARQVAERHTVHLVSQDLDQPYIEAAFALLPPPPAQPTPASPNALLAPLHMVQTEILDPSALHPGDVVVLAATAPAPAQSDRKYANAGAAVYVIDG